MAQIGTTCILAKGPLGTHAKEARQRSEVRKKSYISRIIPTDCRTPTYSSDHPRRSGTPRTRKLLRFEWPMLKIMLHSRPGTAVETGVEADASVCGAKLNAAIAPQRRRVGPVG